MRRSPCGMRCHCSPSPRSCSCHVSAGKEYKSGAHWPRISQKCSIGDRSGGWDGQSTDVASDVGVNFKNVGVLSIESSLFHLFHYTFYIFTN